MVHGEQVEDVSVHVIIPAQMAWMATRMATASESASPRSDFPGDRRWFDRRRHTHRSRKGSLVSGHDQGRGDER